MMYRLILIMCIGAVLSACSKTNSYYPRAFGEDWKVYPYVEGSATKARDEGRACWKNDPTNSQGLCY